VVPKELYLVAFHLYREGHEDVGYSERLPHGVVMGDSEADVLHKIGQPSQRGGGNMMPVVNRRVAKWLRYPIGDAPKNTCFRSPALSRCPNSRLIA
jgi:hypothetical protein